MSNSRIFSTLPSNLANNVGKVATVISSNTIGWTTANIEPAFAQANSASSNTIYLQGVNIAQNTSISYVSSVNDTQNNRLNSVESNTVYLFGALNQTNTNIISANTQLKSYTDGVIASANTQLKSYVDGQVNNTLNYVSGVDASQNTAINNNSSNTVYLFGALNQTNTNIVSANTQLKSYTDDIVSQANTWLQANDAYTLSVSKTYTDNSNTQLKSYSDGMFYQKTGGIISGAVTISSSLTVTGNLTVSGNVTTVSANNLLLKDNMIYLNEDGSGYANPDLGFTGAYNDGTYHHAGFFRDHATGLWKVFDSYLPEPDASPYIDTSNSSFRIASFQANTINLTANPGTAPLTVSSSDLVVNLNSDYLDGQHGNYYSPLTFTQQAFNQANTALNYSNGIDASQNTRISTVEANTIYLFGALNQTNTNIVNANTQLKSYVDGQISGVTSFAQAAYNQANTDYTTISVTAGDYGGTTAIPVIKLAANGRISSISNTSITAGATITDDNTTNATRYLMLGTATSGNYTVANTSSSKLQFNPSKGELTANAHPATSGMLVHSNVINSDYTLDANNNAVSAGPISIANGVIVTVSSGAIWTIV